jgi:outer membrane protein
LFNGFQLQNELKKSKLDYLASQNDLQKIVNDISLNVAAAYLQVLYAREQLTAAENRAATSARLRDRTARLVEEGVLAQGGLLDAESQVAADELARVTAGNDLQLATLALGQLLELDEPGAMRVEEPRMDIPDQSALGLTPAAIYDQAVNEKPEIKSADFKVQSAERSLAIARGGMYPRLRAFGSVSSGYSNQALQRTGDPIFDGLVETGAVTQSGEAVLNQLTLYQFEQTPFADQLDQNLNETVGLSLEIPIFNGWFTQNNIRRAKLLHDHARFGADLARQQLRKSIQQAHADAQAALNRFNAAGKSAEALRESFRYAERKYDAGLVNALDLSTVQINAARAESEHLQAKYDFIFRLKVLDFYLGKPLVY